MTSERVDGVGDPVAIVIPTFNALPHLRRCLQSLKWCRDDGVELVIVDSGSVDGSLPAVQEEAPWARVVHGDASMWWTASVAAGIDYARDALGARRLCLLNHDCVWDRSSYFALMEALAARPDDIVCSHVAAAGDGHCFFAGGVRRRSGMLTVRGFGDPPSIRYPSGPVVWCGGMGVAFTTAVYERIGGFDPTSFPHYYGDSDFCLRGARRGVGVWFCAESRVVNDTGSSGHTLSREGIDVRALLTSLLTARSIYNVRDTTRFYWRHQGVWAAVALLDLYAMWLGAGVTRVARGTRGRRRNRRRGGE